MAFRYVRHAAFIATLVSTCTAQQSNVVPDDLEAGFKTGTEVQVSYTGQAVNGFRDGTAFEKDGQ